MGRLTLHQKQYQADEDAFLGTLSFRAKYLSTDHSGYVLCNLCPFAMDEIYIGEVPDLAQAMFAKIKDEISVYKNGPAFRLDSMTVYEMVGDPVSGQRGEQALLTIEK